MVKDDYRACRTFASSRWLALGLLTLACASLAREEGGVLADFDFNDYAVGLASTVSQQPYAGVAPTQVLFPFLTSLKDSTMTDAAFVARNGTYGLRRVQDSGLEFGVQTRVETLGFGADPDSPLDRLDPPQWTLELGPSIGWRRGPVQPDLALRKGIWGGHDGWVGDFSLSLPREFARGYVVPYVMARFQDGEYLDHYFGLRPRVGQGRDLPDYRPPDEAISYRLGFRAGYRLNDLWLLTGGAHLEVLDDEIQDSPVVERNTTAAFTLGIAYNRSIFVERNPDWRGELNQERLSLSVYSVAGRSRTELEARSRSGGSRDLLPFDRSPEFLRADSILRIGNNHRLELSYADVQRSQRTVPLPGDTGTLRFSQDSRFLRTAYGYSLRNNAQQELGVLVGVHWPRLTATLTQDDGRERKIDASSPMVAVGAFGRLAMRHGFSAEARLELGGLDFARYDGAVVDGRVSLAWKPRDRLAVLLGYSWQLSRLEGYDDNFVGRFSQQTHGPLLGLRVLL